MASPVVQELAEVVDGGQELDLGVGGVVAEVGGVPAQPAEQLDEGGPELAYTLPGNPAPGKVGTAGPYLR